ncbi:phosphatidylserine decarboxylase 1 [Orbilia oligospora]|uniref:Phosphatidylserine decarboxylase proenzyme 1, mitochondrial n=1 Tax=Orbilia oligospora TaxID=2813651 RepID=A0A6G1LWZ0_ORBOL|nr:phosphatidylserine decarboxylase 1 [Orbilia oligospora]KAF3204158.1 phosphatidylserine decarboxylase 1 [Orbilia oligospora]KAF3211277.1 phosphatidylserine decarboxylase 1 [Orbilia oligospora]KAF3235547.1 phosphatidylserine decarboxylase 1 [Orbilia oligospora]
MQQASRLVQQRVGGGPLARPCIHLSLHITRRPILPRKNIFYRTDQHLCFSSSSSSGPKKSFFQRLKMAWDDTPIKWTPIPVGLGITYLGFKHYSTVMSRERQIAEEEDPNDPQRKRKIRPTGPWQVQILSTLPLKALSRLWGKFNEIPLPVIFRPFGFKLYAFIFGVNISEAKNQDLKSYKNLAEFFYREIDPAVRPIDKSSAVVSPSDGKVLMVGEVREGGKVENVKGMTYSLDALLSGHGETKTSSHPSSPGIIFGGNENGTTEPTTPGGQVVDSHEEFARMNGISYTVGELFSGTEDHIDAKAEDQSLPPGDKGDVAAVVGTKSTSWFRNQLEGPKRLYFAVIYLAPGDYHRFHSPTEWVVETRRHFAGELFSVSPYLQALLPSLFILNERVVLLGRWKHGFFSMTPVGATNVGSIVLNFDRELRTNSLTKDTKADTLEGHGYAEAHYQLASQLLSGHPLRRGEEMGGFRLGSTIVLVFEAPERKDGKGFKWTVEQGKTVKMGEALGLVE